MANIKSNTKRRKQDDKRYLRNKSIKSGVKTAIKKANLSKKQDDINNAVSLIDNAVSKGVFHKNKGARLVSNVQKLAN